MLQELHIESLGVIEQLDLVLGAGLTALTGETGAGKTLLVEAISLLVGGRADATMVRPGAAEARVEGRFVVGDDEYVVARVVPADGRSRAYVNGRLATVGNLAELGARFVDLHGQHSHQSLLSAAKSCRVACFSLPLISTSVWVTTASDRPRIVSTTRMSRVAR